MRHQQDQQDKLRQGSYLLSYHLSYTASAAVNWHKLTLFNHWLKAKRYKSDFRSASAKKHNNFRLFDKLKCIVCLRRKS